MLSSKKKGIEKEEKRRKNMASSTYKRPNTAKYTPLKPIVASSNPDFIPEQFERPPTPVRNKLFHFYLLFLYFFYLFPLIARSFALQISSLFFFPSEIQIQN